MLRFFRGEIQPRGFFSQSGYTNWDFLNNEYQAKAIHFLRGWNRALIDFAGGISCREGERSIAERYQSLPSVRFVYLDTVDECRFTYQIVVAFDHKEMSKEEIKYYNHWNSLNYIYGVVKVGHELLEELKAVLEFEPGLYTHHQMKAIRDEYLKLPGIKFGWIMGKKAMEVSTIILNFDRNFLRRVPMRRYDFWSALNKRYSANITILEEGNARAYIRFPQGIHSDDLKLKAILRKYRQLPGIVSVRMDRHRVGRMGSWSTPTSTSETTSSLNERRSLKSWLTLSQGDTSRLPPDLNNENNNLDNRIDPPGPRGWGSQCINVH